VKNLLRLAVTSVVLGLTVGAFAQEIEKAEAWTVPCAYTNAAGKVFRYRWSEPPKVEAGKTYPLVILLHGAGERGADNRRQLLWGGTPLLSYMRERKIEGYFLAGQVPDGKRWVEKDWSALSHQRPCPVRDDGTAVGVRRPHSRRAAD